MVEVFGDAIRKNEWESLAQPLWRAEQIRSMERRWAEQEGLPLYVLMERAGNALCNYACHHWPDSRQWSISSALATTVGMATCWPALPGASASNLW